MSDSDSCPVAPHQWSLLVSDVQAEAGVAAWDDGQVADRRNATMRDMAVAVGVLVVGLLIIIGAMGGYSFKFGAPTDGVAPSADVIGGFGRAGETLGIEVVVPQGLPEAWQPNSFSLNNPAVGAAGAPVVRGGWLTPDGTFITLLESSAPGPVLVAQEVGQGLDSRGQVEAAGSTWDIYPGERSEPVWVRTSAGVTLLITGSAPTAAFETLADALA